MAPKIEEEPFDWVATYGKVATTGKTLAFENLCPSLKKWFFIRMQNEEQYKKLANSITDIFFAVDSSLKFTYWNKTTEKYTKITSEKAIGKHVYEILGRDKPVEEQLNCFLVL